MENHEFIKSIIKEDFESSDCEDFKEVYANWKTSNLEDGILLLTSRSTVPEREPLPEDEPCFVIFRKNLVKHDERKIDVSNKENISREKLIQIAPKPARANKPRDSLTKNCEVASNSVYVAKGKSTDTVNANGLKRKIPRPANAFMLFANDWRKRLAAENPRESNKDISVRLGVLWRNMAKDQKEKYFALAREVDAEHKKKYPDYVYNPKEARLRKAMREQSRELSRRSVLQSGVANCRINQTGYQEHRLRYGSPSASTLNTDHRESGWSYHQRKPFVSLRSGRQDWYDGIEQDHPIDRLQAMGHQRGYDKSAKTIPQSLDCSSYVPNAATYSADFVVSRERDYRQQDFEGQKWHPYQNGSPQPNSQIGMMHSNMPNPNPPQHGLWNQFFHGGLSHASNVTKNNATRGPRHTVFVRDRPTNRHCGYSSESSKLAYGAGKLDILENARDVYHASSDLHMRLMDPQMNNQVESSSSSMLYREENENVRWNSNGVVPNEMPLDKLNDSPSESRDRANRQRVVEQQQRHHESKPVTRPVSLQPLPGFHQAFGSTEIGRFSRSEYFVNMVTGDGVVGEKLTDESGSLYSDTYSPDAMLLPLSTSPHANLGNSAARHFRRAFLDDQRDLGASYRCEFVQPDQPLFASSNSNECKMTHGYHSDNENWSHRSYLQGFLRRHEEDYAIYKPIRNDFATTLQPIEEIGQKPIQDQ